MKDELHQTSCLNSIQLQRRITSAVNRVDADLFQVLWNNGIALPCSVITENESPFQHFWQPVERLSDTEYRPNIRC